MIQKEKERATMKAGLIENLRYLLSIRRMNKESNLRITELYLAMKRGG